MIFRTISFPLRVTIISSADIPSPNTILSSAEFEFCSLITSFPSPRLKIYVSLPYPPQRVSLPLPPTITSSPLPPLIVSPLSEPARKSALFVPLRGSIPSAANPFGITLKISAAYSADIFA